MDITLQGNLGHFSTSEMLRFLAASGRTGTMRLMSAGRETWAFLDSGTLVYARSDQELMHMPLVLTRRSKITKDQRSQLDQLVQREGEKFAQAAIKQNLFAADQLRDLSREFVTEVMVDALLWEGGTFAFSLDLDLPESAIPVSMKIDELIELGSKRMAEWQECRKLFPDANKPYQVVGDPEADEKITLSVPQFKMLLKMKELGAASVEQLARILERDILEIYHTMDVLRSSHLITEAAGSEKVAPPPAKAPVAAPPPAPPMPAPAPKAPVPIALEMAPPQVPSTPPPAPSSDSQDDIPTSISDWRKEIASAAPEPPPPGPPLEIAEPEPTVATPLAASFGIKPPAAEPKKSMASMMGVLTLDNADKTAFPLFETEYSIGREATNMIQIPDSSVSGSHARIRKTPDGYLLEDLNSRNGSYVNGERIQSRMLKNDDKIRLGKVHMIFNLPTEMLPTKTTAPGD